jgi:hypothetical protein
MSDKLSILAASNSKYYSPILLYIHPTSFLSIAWNYSKYSYSRSSLKQEWRDKMPRHPRFRIGLQGGGSQSVLISVRLF